MIPIQGLGLLYVMVIYIGGISLISNNGVKHSVAGARLENVVIALSLILLFVICIMIYGEFFKG